MTQVYWLYILSTGNRTQNLNARFWTYLSLLFLPYGHYIYIFLFGTPFTPYNLEMCLAGEGSRSCWRAQELGNADTWAQTAEQQLKAFSVETLGMLYNSEYTPRGQKFVDTWPSCLSLLLEHHIPVITLFWEGFLPDIRAWLWRFVFNHVLTFML